MKSGKLLGIFTILIVLNLFLVQGTQSILPELKEVDDFHLSFYGEVLVKSYTEVRERYEFKSLSGRPGGFAIDFKDGKYNFISLLDEDILYTASSFPELRGYVVDVSAEYGTELLFIEDDYFYIPEDSTIPYELENLLDWEVKYDGRPLVTTYNENEERFEFLTSLPEVNRGIAVRYDEGGLFGWGKKYEVIDLSNGDVLASNKNLKDLQTSLRDDFDFDFNEPLLEDPSEVKLPVEVQEEAPIIGDELVMEGPYPDIADTGTDYLTEDDGSGGISRHYYLPEGVEVVFQLEDVGDWDLRYDTYDLYQRYNDDENQFEYWNSAFNAGIGVKFTKSAWYNMMWEGTYEVIDLSNGDILLSTRNLPDIKSSLADDLDFIFLSESLVLMETDTDAPVDEVVVEKSIQEAWDEFTEGFEEALAEEPDVVTPPVVEETPVVEAAPIVEDEPTSVITLPEEPEAVENPYPDIASTGTDSFTEGIEGLPAYGDFFIPPSSNIIERLQPVSDWDLYFEGNELTKKYNADEDRVEFVDEDGNGVYVRTRRGINLLVYYDLKNLDGKTIATNRNLDNLKSEMLSDTEYSFATPVVEEPEIVVEEPAPVVDPIPVVEEAPVVEAAPVVTEPEPAPVVAQPEVTPVVEEALIVVEPEVTPPVVVEPEAVPVVTPVVVEESTPVSTEFSIPETSNIIARLDPVSDWDLYLGDNQLNKEYNEDEDRVEFLLPNGEGVYVETKRTWSGFMYYHLTNIKTGESLASNRNLNNLKNDILDFTLYSFEGPVVEEPEVVETTEEPAVEESPVVDDPFRMAPADFENLIDGFDEANPINEVILIDGELIFDRGAFSASIPAIDFRRVDILGVPEGAELLSENYKSNSFPGKTIDGVEMSGAVKVSYYQKDGMIFEVMGDLGETTQLTLDAMELLGNNDITSEELQDAISEMAGSSEEPTEEELPVITDGLFIEWEGDDSKLATITFNGNTLSLSDEDGDGIFDLGDGFTTEYLLTDDGRIAFSLIGEDGLILNFEDAEYGAQDYSLTMGDGSLLIPQFDSQGNVIGFKIQKPELEVQDQVEPEVNESEQITFEMGSLTEVLQGMNDMMKSGSAGVYTFIDWMGFADWVDPNKEEQSIRANLVSAVAKDFGYSLRDIEGSVCQYLINVKAPKPDNSIQVGKYEQVPTLQLQALRSEPLIYPSNYIVEDLINPIGIELSQADVEEDVEEDGVILPSNLFYYKITFNVGKHVTFKGGTYDLGMFGKDSDGKIYTVLLDGDDSTVHVSSGLAESRAGEQAMVYYWPVKLTEVCLRIFDHQYILEPSLVNKLNHNGNIYTYCTEVAIKPGTTV